MTGVLMRIQEDTRNTQRNPYEDEGSQKLVTHPQAKECQQLSFPQEKLEQQGADSSSEAPGGGHPDNILILAQ